MHRKVKEVAKVDGLSINQFISSAVSEKLASVFASNYLEKSARRGDREKFERVLKKVSGQEPLEEDRL